MLCQPGAWSALGQPEGRPPTEGGRPEGHSPFAQLRSVAGTGVLCWARWPAAPTRVAKSLREQRGLTRTPPPALNPESVDAASNTKDLRGSWGGASEACHAGHALCRHAEEKVGAHRKRLHKVASLPSPRLNVAWWCRANHITECSSCGGVSRLMPSAKAPPQQAPPQPTESVGTVVGARHAGQQCHSGALFLSGE